MRCFFLTAAILPLLHWQALAEPTPPSFANGFELLAALGPQEPAKGATWQAIGASTDVNRSPFSNSLSELTQQFQGKGWLVESLADGKIRAIPFGSVLPIETMASGQSESSPGLLGKLFGGGDKKPDAPDLKKDVAQLIAGISKLKTSNEEDPFDSDDAVDARSFGPTLLFAAQLHRAGHPDLADQLAWAIFQVAPSREQVLDAAIDSLGDELYQESINRFFQSWDWQAYQNELTALVKKFPRGWETQPAAAMVLDSLALRLNGQPAPTPTAPGVTLTAEALDAIAWMLEKPADSEQPPDLPPEIAQQLERIPPEYHAQFLEAMNQRQSTGSLSNPGLWLLKTPEQRAAIKSPAAPLFKLGLDALPVLAALATDNYPIPHRLSFRGGGNYYYSSDSHPLERAIALHASMQRPATRGDVARALLAATLPDPEEELNPNDADLLSDLAIEFYKSHQGKDWSELAAVFMTDGSSSQKSQAAGLLANSPLPDHQQRFETLILESNPAYSMIEVVVPYAQKRKAAAKPFIDRYVALVREEVGDGSALERDYSISWELRQPGHINQLLKQLESLASGKSPQTLAREIARSPLEDAKSAIPAFFGTLSTEKPQAQMAAMLTGAYTAEAPEIRSIFLTYILNVDWDEAEPPVQKRRISASEATIWKKLFADDRPVFEEHDLADSDYGTTIRELAACAAESCIAPGEFGPVVGATNILKLSIPELCRLRMDARLAGQPIPPLPDPENVNASRLKEIITTAAAKPTPEVIPYLDSLTPDERAAWEQWFWDPDPAVPESILDLNMSIVNEDTSEGSIPLATAPLNLTLGTEINAKSFDALIASIAADAAKHSLTYAWIYPADFPPGLTASVTRAIIPTAGEEPDEDAPNASNLFGEETYLFELDNAPPNATAIINLEWSDEENEVQAYWWIIDGKPVPFTIDDEGEIQPNPESNLPALITAARNSAEDIYIDLRTITRADIQRIPEDE